MKFQKSLFLLLLSNLSLFAVNITFQVDMQYEEDISGAYLLGDWDSYTIHEMDKDEDSDIYTLTLTLDLGDITYYFSTTSDGWSGIESIMGSGREYSVSDTDSIIPLVCFNSSDPCPETVYYPVTLTFTDPSNYYDNIWFKTSADDFTTAYQGIQQEDGSWSYITDYNFADPVYEWGAIQSSDSIGTQLTWLTPNNPNLSFTLLDGGEVSEESVITYSLDLFPVVVNVIDATSSFDNLRIRVSKNSEEQWTFNPSEFTCTDTNNDYAWECDLALEPASSISWEVLSTTFCVNTFEINSAIDQSGTNLIFSIDESGNISGDAELEIPAILGSYIQKSVEFRVDMTEWIIGLSGIQLFNPSNDEIQVRGDWNDWSGADLANMVQDPIYTSEYYLTEDLCGFENGYLAYKFYMLHSSESIDSLETQFGELNSDIDWGWEDSPRYGGGNRSFKFSDYINSNSDNIVINEGYYDLPSGGIIPEGKQIQLTYSVTMSVEDGYNQGDSVNLVLRDKWTNYMQGFEISSVIDNNPVAKFVASCGGLDCTASVNLVGPLPWHTLYTWEYKNTNDEWISEGSDYGDYGKYRARYIHPDYNGNWVDYSFSKDTFHIYLDQVYEPEEYDLSILPLNGCTDIEACNYSENAINDDGSCEYEIDECGICGGDGSRPDLGLDCFGEPLTISRSTIPENFSIREIYPNPFNPITSINYSIAQLTELNFSIYNILGEKILTLYNGVQQPGYHSIHWNASEHSSGIYFLKMELEQYIQVKKLILVK